MKQKRTLPHSNFRDLSKLEIDMRFVELNYDDEYSEDLVRDFANAYSHILHGNSVESSFVEIKENAPDYEYHKKIQAFIKNLDFDEFLGDTPLHKSTYIMKFIRNYLNNSCNNTQTDKLKQQSKPRQSEEKQKENSENNGNSNNDKDKNENKKQDNQNNNNNDKNNGKPKKQDFSACENEGNLIPLFDELSEEEIQSFSHQLGQFHQAVRKTAKSYPFIYQNGDVDYSEMIVTLNKKQLNIIDKLAILEFRGKIKSNKITDKLKFQQMQDYSDVSRLQNMSSMLMPNFKYKLATKDLIAKRTVPANKQCLVLLIDYSGSMSCYEKISWVNAIVYNRLSYVINNSAELFIVFFIGSPDFNNAIHIKTKQEAINFGKNFRYNPNGGITDIESTLKETIKAINNRKIGRHVITSEKPQIVVMNDGQDHIDENYKPEIITHGFILGQDNNDLKKVIQSSGGHFERFL
jgi:hypothetical protein